MVGDGLGRLAAIVLLACLIAGSISPIWSNDFFWHLAAGRWIVEHRALPAADPLAVASSREPWINGEWLFQVMGYAVMRLGGVHTVVGMRAIAIALLFTLLFVRARREIPPVIAFAAAFFSWYGALPWLRERPATIGTIFLVLLIAILQRGITPGRTAAIAVLVVIWMNVHPSALLAPATIFIWLVAEMIETKNFSRFLQALGATAVAALSLLVNPHGVRGVLNPLHVAKTAQLPIFSNEEWTRTSLREFPLFTLALLAWAIVLITSARRRQCIPAAVMAFLLAALAMRFSRNQPLFYAATPLLLMPHVRPIAVRFQKTLAIPIVITAIAILLNSDFSSGVNRDKFPVAATQRVLACRLPGHVLSPYAMGGFLEWAFAPERRVLTDGRNELFTAYQTRLLESRRNPESWSRFIEDHAVAIAYVPHSSPPVFVRDATGERRPMWEWDVYFPRESWALVATDPAAAVFARRDRVDGALLHRVELPREMLMR